MFYQIDLSITAVPTAMDGHDTCFVAKKYSPLFQLNMDQQFRSEKRSAPNIRFLLER